MSPPRAASAPDRLGEMPENAVGGARGTLGTPKGPLRQRLIAKLKGSA